MPFVKKQPAAPNAETTAAREARIEIWPSRCSAWQGR